MSEYAPSKNPLVQASRDWYWKTVVASLSRQVFARPSAQFPSRVPRYKSVIRRLNAAGRKAAPAARKEKQAADRASNKSSN
jgi:hypothetical protein